MGWIILLVVLVVYFLPSAVAFDRYHRNAKSILVLNLFLGWTMLGWVGSLAWAYTDNVKNR